MQRQGLSIDSLRKYDGLETLSDDDARQSLKSIEKLAQILFNLLKNQEIKSYENEPLN